MNIDDKINFNLVDAPLSLMLFARSYAKTINGKRETPEDVLLERTINGLKELGHLSSEEVDKVRRLQSELKLFVSGRSLFVLGTSYSKEPKNFYSQYNCNSLRVETWDDFGLVMDLAMQGVGTGVILEENIENLPLIRNKLSVEIKGQTGDIPKGKRYEFTQLNKLNDNTLEIIVGDSREGWVKAYQTLLEESTNESTPNYYMNILVDISHVRAVGEPLNGFGGVANPVELPPLFHKCARVLNKALGRKLNSIECCLLIDEAASTIVAGNIRRCLSGDTNVLLSDGSTKEIKYIEVGDMVATPSGPSRVIEVQYQGLLEVYNISFFLSNKNNELRLGSIYCSADHKIPIINEDGSGYTLKQAKDINKADRVYIINPYKVNEEVKAEDIKESYIYLEVSNLNRYERMWDIEIEGEDKVFFANGLLVSNSAGMRQGAYEDKVFKGAKNNLWEPDDNGNWKINPEKDALRMANHTRVLKHKPTYQECLDAVTIQFNSGEGAIQNAVEAIARANVDLLNTQEYKQKFISLYCEDISKAKDFLNSLSGNSIDEREMEHRINRYGLNPCFSGDSRLLTSKGYIPFRQLKGIPFEVISSKGNVYSSQVWCSGKKKIIHLVTNINQNPSIVYQNNPDLTPEPLIIKCTSNHMLSTTQGDFIAEDCLGRVLIVPLNHTPYIYSYNFKDINWEYENNLNYIFSSYKSLYEAKLLIDRLKQIGVTPFILYMGEECYRVVIYKYTDLCLFYNSISSPFTKDLFDYLNNNRPIVIDIREGEIENVYDFTVPDEHWGIVEGVKAHNCGEIIGKDFLCNLSEVHLNNINPLDIEEQKEAFNTGGIIVASLLNHQFVHEKLRYSREKDPIVGVSFTGLFDFFTEGLGITWLKWWEENRRKDYQLDQIPEDINKVSQVLNIDTSKYRVEQGIKIGQLLFDIEVTYLRMWKEAAFKGVYEYCDSRGLKRPNRCTTVQPAGSKSLLTGASSGWHPPKAVFFIRRMTFRREDPIALAAIDFGYNVVPSQNATDEQGKLLKDPFDPKVNEWLVEVPVKVKWAYKEGVENINIGGLSVESQWDFYLNIQQNYTTHNSSGTLELTKDEIEPLSQLIYEAIQNDKGYISVALLQRFNKYYPLLPFEPIDKDTYYSLSSEIEKRRKCKDFLYLLQYYTDLYDIKSTSPQDSACEGMICEMKF